MGGEEKKWERKEGREKEERRREGKVSERGVIYRMKKVEEAGKVRGRFRHRKREMAM